MKIHCKRCGFNSHYANGCFATKGVDGKKIYGRAPAQKPQGNSNYGGNRAAGGRRYNNNRNYSNSNNNYRY